MCNISELYMRERCIATHRGGRDQSPSWKHTGKSSSKRLWIGSLQQIVTSQLRGGRSCSEDTKNSARVLS